VSSVNPGALVATWCQTKTGVEMKFSHLVGAAFLGAAFASPAVAACSQSDLAGTWKVVASSTDNGDFDWLYCTATIGQGGTPFGGTTCVGANGKKRTFSKGLVSVQSDCSITGSFKVKKITENIVFGQMNQDKLSFSGVGVTKIGKKKDGSFAIYATKQ
jgi:hypothetical protein